MLSPAATTDPKETLGPTYSVCLLDQMRGDDAIDYPEHQARDHRTAGEPAEATIYRFRDCVNEFNRKANRGYQLIIQQRRRSGR